MTEAYLSTKPGDARVHTVLAGLSILAGINYFGVAWTGLLLLMWVVWAIWPGLKSGMPAVAGALPAVAAIWLAWLIALVWISDTPYLSWFYCWTLAGLPVALLVWQFVQTPDEAWRWIRYGLWVGAVILSVQGIWQVLSGTAPRAHGPLIDPNAYAGTLNLVFFPLAAWFFARDWSYTPRWATVLKGGVLFGVALAFFSANSRGGGIAWLLGMAALLFAMRGRPNYRLKMILLLGIWGVAFLVMYSLIKYSLVQVASMQDESVSARWFLWKSTWLMIRANSWLGTGLGTWSLHYPAFRDAREWGTTGYYAHNDYLQLLAEGGPVTLLILLALLALAAHLLWRLVRAQDTRAESTEAAGLLIGVLAVAAHAFVNFIFYHAFICILCGLFIGRALQITGRRAVSQVRLVPVATPFTRKLLVGTAVFVAAIQLLLHETARLLNCNHPVIAAIHRVYPPFTEYEVARFIHAVRPQEPIPRTIVLQYMAEGIDEAALLGPGGPLAVLNETLEAYEQARKSAPNRTQLGAEEAMLLINHRKLLPNGEALRRAEDVAFETLKLDPRHAEAILALAEVQFMRNHTAAGLQILAQAIPHLFSIRDRKLLEVVYVRHLVAPARYPQLDEIERVLRKTPSVSVGGTPADTAALNEKAEAVMRDVLRQAGRLKD
ncbi:MAG: O-antigen ligase family protein [Betaproteobacteria bacterium]|nr:O-antigen ligase family protein [Betaproteobacteria bacterium]